MWYFEALYRDKSGSVQRADIPLDQHIEDMKADSWDDWEIAGSIISRAKWVDCETDAHLPDGTPVELLPRNEATTDIDIALELLRISTLKEKRECYESTDQLKTLRQTSVSAS